MTMKLPALGLLLASCAATVDPCPIPGAVPADDLILPGEDHFAHLWQVTFGGENAEAYWSFDGERLCMQVRNEERGWNCDRICVTEADGTIDQLSNGRGVTTCSYFMPDGGSVIFASTHGEHETCPPPADRSQGYVWQIHPEYEIYRHVLGSGDEPFVTGPGYDAEATVSPTGDRVVFTSTRSGDLELWTCDLDGGDLQQVTTAPGYDGGAFFSHDGKQLVFRATAFTPGAEAEEQAEYFRLLEQGLVRPSRMELFVINTDGTERRQLTELGKANFAPSFFPDDSKVIFSTNHHDPDRPALNFDLFALDLATGELEQITRFDGPRGKSFDGFPLFSPDGRYLAFSSNRGDSAPGETNVFIAEWR